MKYKLFTLYVLVGVMLVGGANIALARVYNKEKVTKAEVAKYFGNNWEQNDFSGGLLFEQIATDSVIESLAQKNSKVAELRQKAIDSKSESTTASGS